MLMTMKVFWVFVIVIPVIFILWCQWKYHKFHLFTISYSLVLISFIFIFPVSQPSFSQWTHLSPGQHLTRLKGWDQVFLVSLFLGSLCYNSNFQSFDSSCNKIAFPVSHNRHEVPRTAWPRGSWHHSVLCRAKGHWDSTASPWIPSPGNSTGRDKTSQDCQLLNLQINSQYSVCSQKMSEILSALNLYSVHKLKQT